MVTREEEIILVIFAFMVVFWTFPLCRLRTRPTLVLMEYSVGAQYFPVVIVYSLMRGFSQRLWSIKPNQNMHYDIVEGDV